MTTETNSKENPNKARRSASRASGGLRWVLIAGGVAWVILMAVATWHPGIVGRVKFASDSTLNLLVALAVVAQVIIYRRMAGQNELLIRASEENAEVAREAFRAGERAYFGILTIEPEDFGPDPDRFPKIKIDFWNGGKTPAWHIHTFVEIGLGDHPDTCQRWPMTLDSPSMRNTFVTAQNPQGFKYCQTGFQYTAERMHQVENDKLKLFVIAKIHYRDFRKVWHSQVFRAVWFPHGTSPQFVDFDASEHDCKICTKHRGEGQ